MVKLEGIDTLKMIKSEMDINLTVAQEALKAFSELPEDQNALHSCLKSCEQIRGIFRWLQFTAGVQLMTEVAQLGKRLLGLALQYETQPHNFNDSQFNDLIILFNEALLVLGRYLEYSVTTQNLLPVLLIPIINKLRRAAEQLPLEESAFLLIKESLWSQPLPAFSFTPTGSPERLVQMAKSLRQNYQTSLLALMKGENRAKGENKAKGENRAEHFIRLHQVMRKIYQWSATTALAPLWWVALAAIEAMQTQQIELTPARLSVLQKLDKPLKALAYEGMSALNEPPSRALMKACIYLASLVENAQAPALTQVRHHYELHHSLSDQALRIERALMEGPENSTLNSVIRELQTELNNIKERVDACAVGAEPWAAVQQVAELLRKTARTLMVMGLVEPGQLLKDQAEHLLQHTELHAEQRQLKLTQLADSLLYVERAMAELNVRLVHDEQALPDGRALSDLEQARRIVISESRANLSLIKRSIDTWLESGETTSLTELSSVFEATYGALHFLHLIRAAQILRHCGEYIEKKRLDRHAAFPLEQEFAMLADALVGVEYYLDMMNRNQWLGDGILDIAEQGVVELNQEVVLVA